MLETGVSRDGKKVYLLDDARVDHYWPEVIPLLDKVPLFCELYSSQDVYVGIKRGDFQLWALSDGKIRAIVLTTINIFPQAKVLQILAVSGKDALKFWDELDATLEWLARDLGCSMIQAVGRLGFKRSKFPGKIEGVVMTKRIEKIVRQ